MAKTSRVSKKETASSNDDQRVLGIIRGLSTEERGKRFDRLIHERLRLAIVSALAVNDRLTFNELKDILKTTDGNLSVHARKLEDAKYIKCVKFFEGRVPRTEYQITKIGRRALEKYLGHMESLVRAVKGE